MHYGYKYELIKPNAWINSRGINEFQILKKVSSDRLIKPNAWINSRGINEFRILKKDE
jgi:hypothetical protein